MRRHLERRSRGSPSPGLLTIFGYRAGPSFREDVPAFGAGQNPGYGKPPLRVDFEKFARTQTDVDQSAGTARSGAFIESVGLARSWGGILSSSLTTYISMAASMRKTTTHVIHFCLFLRPDEWELDAACFFFRE